VSEIPPPAFTRILVIADIEGSSGCHSRRAAAFLNDAWARACLEMSRDVDAVVRSLFDAGARQVTVKDFHRTAYNLLPECIDGRAELVSGYRRGPVPGIGSPAGAQALMMIGMHAASGTDGFLAHTFTSRIADLRVNGAAVPEAVFFSASVAPYGVRPIFFSGCPLACRQAAKAIPGIETYPIEKPGRPGRRFDGPVWRRGLAAAAGRALQNRSTAPLRLTGPFTAEVRMRDGVGSARRLGRRWNLHTQGDRIAIRMPDFQRLYMTLIRLCYLTPTVDRMLPLGLFLFNLRGLLGRAWARNRLRRMGLMG
jgi:D-amino peptidase